jgi:hypothetical protein
VNLSDHERSSDDDTDRIIGKWWGLYRWFESERNIQLTCAIVGTFSQTHWTCIIRSVLKL